MNFNFSMQESELKRLTSLTIPRVIAITAPILFVSSLVGGYFVGNDKFNKSYNRSMHYYADTNGDNIISEEERDHFRKDIYAKMLKEHDAYLIGEDVIDIYGRKILGFTLSNWLDNYNPHNKKK